MKKVRNTISTDRLLLRPMTDEEWTLIVNSVFENDECMFQFGAEKSKELLVITDEPNRKAVTYYAVVLKGTDELVGYAGFAQTLSNIEFYVFKEYRRKGYACEAIRTFMDSCLKGEITGKPQKKFYAEVNVDNAPCIGLLEKLGFRLFQCGFNLSGAGLLKFEYVAG